MLVAVVSSAATAVVPGRRGAAPCATATSGVAGAAEAAWDIRRRSSASFSTLQQSSQAFRHRSVVAQSRLALSSSSSSLRGIEMGVKRSLGARQTHKRLLSSSIRSQAAGLFASRLSHVCLSFLGKPSSFCICSSVSLLGFCVLSTATRVSIPFARVSLETGSLIAGAPSIRWSCSIAIGEASLKSRNALLCDERSLICRELA
jgi:hypothetical protein